MNTTGHRRSTPSLGLPLRYWLVIWLFVLSAVAFLDRTNISIAGVRIGHEFSIDNTRLGWVFSAFLVGYAAFQIPGGMLATRFGPRRVLALGVLWWALFTVLTALVPPGWGSALLLLIAVRFALGAGEATMYPATNQFVERWFPIHERGKANGLIFGGVGLGSGVAPPFITAIMLRYGWRASFWVTAAIGVAASAVWYVISRDRPENHPSISAPELQLIQQGRGTPVSSQKRRTPWSCIFRNKEILALTLSYFTFGYVSWIFFGWFFIYLAQVRHLNLKTSAVFSMLPFIGMTTGCLLGGVLSDWMARRFSLRVGRCWLSAAALVGTAVLLVFGSHASHAATASITLACGAGALYIAQSPYWAVSADIAGENAGVASGMMNMGAQTGGAATASLTPLIAAHFGWNMSFLVAALLAVAGGFTWLLVDPTRPIHVPGLPAIEPSLALDSAGPLEL